MANVRVCAYQLGNRESVVGLDLVEKRKGVVLHHLVLGADALRDLVHPPPHHLIRHKVWRHHVGKDGGGTSECQARHHVTALPYLW